ncbi:MATE family efflux transporter [Photobacterium satsumensis]|uniref:MATE family efflux transporter n=1 Tax=Photobacterium satsumensis TaxID=2910239 RepID=UPI003D09E3D3
MFAVLEQVHAHARGDFMKKVLTIALPITLQNIMFASKGLVDVLMLGQLSEPDLAAIGIASKAFFVATIILLGVSTGGGLLAAQHWGAQNRKGVRESTSLSLFCTLTITMFIVLGICLFAPYLMGVATHSSEVIALGNQYLIITSFSLFGSAIISSYSASLKSMQQPGICTLISGIGITVNILLNWLLIFGHLGFPALGIKGAAIATLVSSSLEVICLFIFLRTRSHLLTLSKSDIRCAITPANIKQFLTLSVPTTFNFLIWAGGIFTYHAIMGNTGTQGLAALAVMTPIESVSLSFLVGIANASAVLIGNQLGAKNYDAAYYQAISMLCIAVAVTIAVSLFILSNQGLILDQFSAISGETRLLSEKFLTILSVGIVLRSVPTTLVVGVLRAGGDVKFCLYQDMLTQWAFGIPLAALSTFWLGLSPEWVFAAFFLETLFKWVASTRRFISRKWINTLV